MRKKKLHPQAFAFCNAQFGFLYAIPLHISTKGGGRYAQYEQQDRGHVYQSEEKAERTQRYDRDESQATHQWVFLGIGSNSWHKKAGFL